ncbi:MAG: protein-L-isoaspartate O-methyltransferase [Betaproteobacteria bacterium]|nr:protein-L-isoaspartate O-methyltransferase [Betaproteobacteria bacterium]
MTAATSATQLCINMVEQQIRPWDVLDDRILGLYYDLPRAGFVPADLRELAYSDTQLPIGEGQTMLEPKLEARLLQELAPAADESILHIGTGTGYFAALLGRLAGRVTSVEIRPALAAQAAANLAESVVANVKVVTGDGFGELAATGPFAGVVLTGSTPVLPVELLDRYAPGGRMVALVGAAPVATLQRVQRVGSQLNVQGCVESWAQPLDNAPHRSEFRF